MGQEGLVMPQSPALSLPLFQQQGWSSGKGQSVGTGQSKAATPRECPMMPKPPPVQDGTQSWSWGTWLPAWPHYPAFLQPALLTQPTPRTLPSTPQYEVKPARRRVLVSWVSRRFPAFPSQGYRSPSRNLLQVLCRGSQEEGGDVAHCPPSKERARSVCSTSVTHRRSHTGQGMLRQAPSLMVTSCLLPICGTPRPPLESALGVSS